MKYSLIVSDVDGCVSPEESSAWNLEQFESLARRVRGEPFASQAQFTLCTGRPQPYVEVLAKLFDIRLPLICENGAVLYDLSSNRSRPGPGVTSQSVGRIRELRSFIETDILPAHPETAIQYGKEAQLSLYTPDTDLMPTLAGKVRSFLSRESGEPLRVDSSLYYLNVSIDGVDKGSALAWLQQELGIPADRTAVVGDTGGDLAMRKHAGYFGAPANATNEVKKAADYVSAKADVSGLMDILDQL